MGNVAGTKRYRHLFGPVPSRRLGRSLGVDLVPAKTCSFDCVFCEVGKTTCRAVLRREYVPLDEILAELKDWLESRVAADYITLAGSGEPTLHTRFGEVIHFLRNKSAIPTALLSNGAMMSLPEVRAAAKEAHLVKVSLSAWDQVSFERINRPARGLYFEEVVEGERLFRQEYRGELWVEVFLVEGINSRPGQVEKIAALVNTIKPDKIHLNTIHRPPAVEGTSAVPEDQLAALAELFSPRAEVATTFKPRTGVVAQMTEEKILDMIRRRPCTAAQIADLFGGDPAGVQALLRSLEQGSLVVIEYRDGEVYYRGVAT